MREIQQRVRQYELMAVFSPDVSEEDLPGAIERVGGYIATAGGEVVSVNQESPWGRRRLAYAIRYQGRDVRDGYYVLYYFDIQSTQIAEIEREIGLNDKLIRHILTIRGEVPVVPEAEEGAAVAAPVEGGGNAGARSEATAPEAAKASAEATEAPAEASEPAAVDVPAEASETVASKDVETEEAVSAEAAPEAEAAER